MARRLITFLGTGNYAEAAYHWLGIGCYQTPYVAAALARLWEATEVVVLATQQAEAHNGEALIQAITEAGAPKPDFRSLPDGRAEDELWQQFSVLRRALEEGGDDELLVDITHGFRAQPFFAAAALSVLRASGRSPDAPEIVYGEFQKAGEVAPIWELTLVTELLDWSQALGLFRRTGVAEPVVELGKRAKKREARRVRSEGGSDFPHFDRLVSAIGAFGADLATDRVASLITGYEQDPRRKHRAKGSAAQLVEAIDNHRAEVRRRVPVLALILDQLREEVEPLAADRLYSERGQKAQLELPRYYLSLGRYAEAAIAAREARVSYHAADEAAVEVNATTFSGEARMAADDQFSAADPSAQDIARIRNDIEHGGFRQQPLAAASLQQEIRQLVARVAADPLPTESDGGPSRRVLLVSRHPGAAEWVEDQGVTIDAHVDHLDVSEHIDEGDIVIGTLPIHVAAEVCQRKARYWHLALDVPPDWRGKELSKEQMEACSARLEPFEVRRPAER